MNFADELEMRADVGIRTYERRETAAGHTGPALRETRDAAGHMGPALRETRDAAGHTGPALRDVDSSPMG